MAAKLRKGDTVIVIAGKDKGREGVISQILTKEGRAIVEGVNMVTRHEKQTQSTQGGRIQKPAAIQLSNLAIKDPKEGVASRVGFKMEGDKKVRFAKKSGALIDG